MEASAGAIPAVAGPLAVGDSMIDRLTELVEKLRAAYGDRLVSVTLYGSAAGHDHHRKFSDVNVLCVLREITPRELGDSEPVFRWWRNLGNPPPLLLSEEEVATSSDCFPIEFEDMKTRRRVLHGKDVIEGIEIDRSFYRAQVEHELRAKLLRLRQRAAAVLSNNDQLLRLMVESLSTFCVLARHGMSLAGIEVAAPKAEVIERLAETGADPEPFRTLLSIREGKVQSRDIEPAPLFADYLKSVEGIVGYVDRLEK